MTAKARQDRKAVDDPLAVLAGQRLEDDGKGATERAYAIIRSAIVRGELRPGTVLGEAELAATLGISRTPVRGALKMLLNEDLVQSGPRRQILVRGVTPEQRREVLLIREALEHVAVREACRLMDIEEMDELRLILIRQRRAANEGALEDFIELDDQFHLGIARGARLPILERFLGQIRAISRLMGLRAVTREGRFEAVIKEHERIVAALEARDPDAALKALDAHLAKTAEILNSIDQDS
jgi:GntR family transcriptional regulator, rspAB operon transcriptional repressor